MTARPRSLRGAEASLLLVTLSWGLSFPLVKGALADAPALAFMGVRALVGWVLLAALLRFRRPRRTALPMGVLLGLLLGVSYATQTLGLMTTTATRSAFITGLCVVIVPLLYPLFTRRSPGFRECLGAFIALLGLWLFTQPGRGGLTAGDWLTLGCAVAYALYVIAMERAGSFGAAADLALVQGAVLVLGFLPFTIVEWEHVRWGRGMLWGIAVTGPILTYTLYAITRHQPGTTATRAAVIYAAEPVFAAGFAWLLLGETLAAAAWGGAAFIVVGMLVAVLGKRA